MPIVTQAPPLTTASLTPTRGSDPLMSSFFLPPLQFSPLPLLRMQRKTFSV
jgi:hypothetical protein